MSLREPRSAACYFFNQYSGSTQEGGLGGHSSEGVGRWLIAVAMIAVAMIAVAMIAVAMIAVAMIAVAMQLLQCLYYNVYQRVSKLYV
jgi:hypothetical protein